MNPILTDSMALSVSAMPRMTRDIDHVSAMLLRDAARVQDIFPATRHYVSPEAVREAVLHHSSFNVIHPATMTKVDIVLRKREEYRLVEFGRRCGVELRGRTVWVVSKEDLIPCKLEWARECAG